jgi:pimeloyl-ACP methyl ester carboxylesterase
MPKIANLYYYELGNPDADSLLIILPDALYEHGFYIDFANRLHEKNPGYQIIIPDYPGVGRSTFQSDEYSATTAASEIGTLLSQLEHDNVLVLGHGFGVKVALQLFDQYTDNLLGLILVAGTVDRIAKEYRHIIELNTRHWLGDPKQGSWFKEIVLQGTFGENCDPDDQKIKYWCEQWYSNSDPNEVAKIISASIGYQKEDQILDQIDVPTLLIHGMKDSVILYESSESMYQKLECAKKILLVPKGTHSLIYEATSVFRNVNKMMEKVRAYKGTLRQPFA